LASGYWPAGRQPHQSIHQRDHVLQPKTWLRDWPGNSVCGNHREANFAVERPRSLAGRGSDFPQYRFRTVIDNSDVGSINSRGWIAGNSATGDIDPNTGGQMIRGVLWKENKAIDLGTLGGLESEPNFDRRFKNRLHSAKMHSQDP
jgi:hypothetical protein